MALPLQEFGLCDKRSTQRQVAANFWTKSISLSQQIHL